MDGGKSEETLSAGLAEQQPCDGCKTSTTTSDVNMVTSSQSFHDHKNNKKNNAFYIFLGGVAVAAAASTQGRDAG